MNGRSATRDTGWATPPATQEAAGRDGAMASATPVQSYAPRHGRSNSSRDADDMRAGFGPPLVADADARSAANASAFGPRTASLANSVAPGSFSTNLRGAANGLRPPLRQDFASYTADMRSDDASASERRQAEFRDLINRETKIKHGSENLLEALLTKTTKQTKEQRLRVESELSSSNRKIAELQSQLQDEIDRSKRAPTPVQGHLTGLFQNNLLRPDSQQSQGLGDQLDEDNETTSPTVLLSELLQALDEEDRQPEYYIVRANALSELFIRNPNLKYDLAWPIFGLRVQTMMLSESREVVAAGYRVTRHAIADRKSLQTIRALHTDTMVVYSLAKSGSKYSIEREQAMKFVRAFLDVKGGINELSNTVVRAVISVAEADEKHPDHLRNVAILTLAELLLKHPMLLVRAGGMTTLADALKDGTYPGSESLAAAFLHLTDLPQSRRLLFSGLELAGPFGMFSDGVLLELEGSEDRLMAAARAISAILNSWPGLFSLSYTGFASIASLLMSLSHPSPSSRNFILDLLFDLLNIKPPAWTSSFLAGRRLTTFSRAANLRTDPVDHQSRLENEDDLNRANIVDHYTALLLTILIKCGLIDALLDLMKEEMEDDPLHRKTTLLLSEVLKLVDQILPQATSSKIQVLNEVMNDGVQAELESHAVIPSNMAFELDRVNRTLHRTDAERARKEPLHSRARSNSASVQASTEPPPTKFSYDMDELRFRTIMTESQVVNHSGYQKWNFTLIHDIVEGPLRNPKRLEDAKSTKFMKRLLAFYRPFKARFSAARNTKPNQRFVRTGCALMKSLLQSAEGVQLLGENKLLRQLAECLAQLDRMSGITSSNPVFSRESIATTMAGGYFAILGALTSEPQGLKMIERWRMINMFYHIIELRDRDDIVRLLLESMDFTIDSHLRVILSKALTSSSKTIRVFATKLLRKYATREIEVTERSAGAASNEACWAIKLLVTQLYDPDMEVSEVAVQILQESCNRKQYLEYVVKCRPALDHLGEIGAPLLLRFLSTSLGYEYLHGLDYITQEMDDWFLGRNEKYVALVETSINRGFFHEVNVKSSSDDTYDRQQLGLVPPHFYRELTRTKEGCRLLEASGHFESFVSTIKDFWEVDDDAETMLKVKGCLWAVGNVGSMELGAPFLERSNVVEYIVKIVEHSRVITMRGTAFFVLGLISRSSHGMEILAERGWDAATDQLGQSLGYILPPSLDILFPSEPRLPRRPPPPLATPKDAPPPASKDDPLEARLYSAVVEFGNSVLQHRATKDVMTLKAKAPHLFKSVPIFQRVLYLLECHTIKSAYRSELIRVFDKDVLRRIVFDDHDEDEEDESSSESDG